MARHHLIANDLALFFSATAADFKKKISSRVYAPWHKHTNDKGFRLIHMILIHAIELAKKDDIQKFDWKATFAKLEEAKYEFSSSDYFPDSHLNLFNDAKSVEVYISMITALHMGGIDVDEKDLIKFLKKTRKVNSQITDLFTLMGFDLKSTLIDMSVEQDIATLTNSALESVRFDPNVKLTCYNDEELAARMNEYSNEQQLKMERIRGYLNSTDISEDRAKELYKCFKISYEKMETYPEFKGKYLFDICLDYGMSNWLKTEAFYTDVQVEIIHLLEEKTNIQFIDSHKNKDHAFKNKHAQKRPFWAE